LYFELSDESNADAKIRGRRRDEWQQRRSDDGAHPERNRSQETTAIHHD
jgi:hypothetical protein